MQLPSDEEIEQASNYLGQDNPFLSKEDIKNILHKRIEELKNAPPSTSGCGTAGFLLTKCNDYIDIWVKPPGYFKQFYKNPIKNQREQ